MARARDASIIFRRDFSLDARKEDPVQDAANQDAAGEQSTVRYDTVTVLFLISLCIPVQLHFGGIRLSPYRVIILTAIIPIIIRLFSQAGFRWKLADTFIILFVIWTSISHIYTGSSIETAAIFDIEVLGSYFIGRLFVSNLATFVGMVRVFYILVAVSLPFAVYEALRADPIVLTILNKFLNALPNVPHETRLGLDRVQYVFDHPILYGLFCATAFSLTIYCRKLLQTEKMDLFGGMVVGLATFLSLSSGAIVCVAFQVGLLIWDAALNKAEFRWKLFVALGGFFYLAIELGSNRTVPEILIPYVSLNPGTAWTRIAVNEAAMEVIGMNPWFGYGLKPWHPRWPAPTGSIDNFWMVIAFRHGVPSIVLLLLSVIFVAVTVATARHGDKRIGLCQTAMVITIASFSASVFTVHIWNAAFAMFFFLLGSGMWVASHQTASRGNS